MERQDNLVVVSSGKVNGVLVSKSETADCTTPQKHAVTSVYGSYGDGSDTVYAIGRDT